MKRASVDGIENGWIRIELSLGKTMELPVEQFPFGIQEGDIVILDENNNIMGKDDDEKERRKMRIREKIAQIRARQNNI